MGYLDWDTVLALDTFYASDNDDAVGIELHTGRYDYRSDNPYGAPDKVERYNLEALAGGSFLKLGDKTLRAVFSNRLYYTYGNDYVSSTGTDMVSLINGTYERAVLTFRNTLEYLPENQILSLERFLCRDNKRVRGIRIMPGYMGIGGDALEARELIKMKVLENSGFLWVQGYCLRALVEDVLYFTRNDRVYTLNYRKRDTLFRGESVAYDTITATEVVLLLN